ncbi:endospore germination permease [Gorillibacterium sp. CAU 1737]|uniref:GerAB/ArcD/ProY family transporter n=1 Tax=Gorillibacterium sp. CAU 1737 TaxID=3140362 RepID=UPI00325FE24E
MNRGTLSTVQLMVMMYFTIVTTAILVVPANTAAAAGTDMWFSPLWALPSGLLSFYAAYRTHCYFPGLTPVQYFPKIMGKFMGKLVGIPYLLILFFMCSLVAREYSEFITGPFLDQTPILVVTGTVMAVCAYAIYKGPVVLGRMSLLFIFPFVGLLLLAVILLYPVMEPRNALPMLEFGIMPSIRASYVAQGWLAEFAFVSNFLPMLPTNSKPLKPMVGSILMVIITLIVVNTLSLFLFSVLNKELNFPFLVALRFISYANFFEHLEAAGMVIWVSTLIVKLSVFYYIVVTNVSDWFGMKDYRPLIVPLGGIVLVTSIFMVPNQETLARVLATAVPFLFLVFFLAVPTLVWWFVALRSRLSSKKAAPS